MRIRRKPDPEIRPQEAATGLAAGLDQEATLREARTAFEKDMIETRLRQMEGNISATADSLGVERSHLHRKIKALGIKTR